MEVRFWGVRGSYPASGAAFSGFGHHTACVSAEIGDHLVVLDAGSGGAALGEHLRDAYRKGLPTRHVHVLLSHFHLDHVMGLPFLLFGAGVDPQAEVAVHCALPLDEPLETIVRRILGAPYFPDEADALHGRIRFHAHRPGESFKIGGATLTSALLEHPGGSAAYRVEAGGASLVYATDCEEMLPPLPALVDLARGVDLLVHDTMFSAEEIRARRGWGHSTLTAALALAEAAEVRRLVGFHHGPTHDDRELAARDADIAAQLNGACLAREGEIIFLPERDAVGGSVVVNARFGTAFHQ
jgi:phosphoribosyl 1,2-cyclic phosphodiesterase